MLLGCCFFFSRWWFPSTGINFFQTGGKKKHFSNLADFFRVTKRWYLEKKTVCDKNSEGLDLCNPQDSNPREWQKQLE